MQEQNDTVVVTLVLLFGRGSSAEKKDARNTRSAEATIRDPTNKERIDLTGVPVEVV